MYFNLQTIGILLFLCIWKWTIFIISSVNQHDVPYQLFVYWLSIFSVLVTNRFCVSYQSFLCFIPIFSVLFTNRFCIGYQSFQFFLPIFSVLITNLSVLVTKRFCICYQSSLYWFKKKVIKRLLEPISDKNVITTLQLMVHILVFNKLRRYSTLKQR